MIECVHCGSQSYRKNGSYQGVQRYKCKQCGRYFSEKPRKFTYADKQRAIDMYLNNCGVRKTARFMGCSSSLIVRWIREFAEQARVQQQTAPSDEPDIIEMDEIYTIVKKTDGGGLDGFFETNR